ncbi:hypothetical protein ACQKMI_06040 [Lysinibacillus sp. NPDC097214]|uniref:hypothetical protein n=1 Tax=Lysinibacillus sp. NPDC097214 TaxID=3390584 RepID=UPI003D034DD3
MCARQRNTINKKIQKKHPTKHVQSHTHCSKDGCIKCSKYPNSCCDKFFVLNLCGLTNSLNYQLLKYKGQNVEIETVSGTKESGILCSFGIDFIEIKEKDDTFVTILKDKISKIYLFADGDHSNLC